MADNADKGRKSLIVMVVTFLILGGGVFGFFIWQGLEDMQEVKFRSFGSGITGRATLPILKYFGFVDNETVAEVASSERKLNREEKYGAVTAGEASAASSSASSVPAAGGARRRGPASGTSAPRMAASMSGPKAGSSGGSKSFSSFSGTGSGPALKLSGGGSEGGAAAAKGGKTMGALVASRGHLSGALATGSALTAKGKWDQSFGLKQAGAGGGGQLASYNSAVASLDEIESGEVSSLKIDDPRSMSVPDVGKPKPVPTSESIADKMKEAAKKNANDAIAQALLGNIPSPAGGSPSGGGDKPDSDAPDMPEGMQAYINTAVMDGDRQYTTTPVKCEKDCPGEVKEGEYYWKVSFTGTGEDGAQYTDECSVFSESGGGFQGQCF